ATARGREVRDRHRELLAQAIERAERAIAVAGDAPRPRAQSILARAHAARAEDALHGAGQLSASAQRAPTPEACDDGWRRVETIVIAAEQSAAAAAIAAEQSRDARLALDASERAARAMLAARKMVDERNDAYTFHVDHGFSFGEGWYLAAAAVLAGVAIQIEPGKPGAAQAERFLRDAGASDRLKPYRSRPRANKQTTVIVARAFAADPLRAQRKLRDAFLGDAPIAKSVGAFVDSRLSGDRQKVLVWIRYGAHHPRRNTTHAEIVELTTRVARVGLVPILVGDALRDGAAPADAIDMTLFWKDPIFRDVDGRRAQLQFFEHLRVAHGVVGQLGVTTAGMDGPALLGMPTMYLTDASNVRMRAWVGAVPGYREIVRESGYLERISDVLGEWKADGGLAPRW
ncbi:MAG TPA: hypothetical protein VIF62_19890, partial [Labilithrix sp.]